jgi:peptidoglycan-associated lipoprotein
MSSRISLFGLSGLAILTLSVVAGCDSPGLTSRKAKSPVAPTQMATGQTTTTGAPLAHPEGAVGPTVDTVGLSVSSAIAKACGIATRAEAVAPSFEYDSAALAEEDRTVLAQVARCLTEGALKGRNVTLVGRADPRGEPEYNLTLGGSRSDTVKRYMVDLGVGRDRMTGTSRGEMDATGTSEQGWAHDRRVDIQLAD